MLKNATFEVKTSGKNWKTLIPSFGHSVPSTHILEQKQLWLIFGQFYKNLGNFLFQHLFTLFVAVTHFGC